MFMKLHSRSTLDQIKFLSPGVLNIIDFDLPIVIQMGVRSCTKNPQTNFVSYENLSPSFCAFTPKLSCREIPKNIQDVLEVTE